MIQCNSLTDLINLSIDKGDDLNCWIYTNISTWNNSPSSAKFFFIDEDEVYDMADDEVYETENGGYLPLSLRELDLYPWFESGTLVGVIENASITQAPGQNEVDRFIFAANYYREYDDFYDYPDTSA